MGVAGRQGGHKNGETQLVFPKSPSEIAHGVSVEVAGRLDRPTHDFLHIFSEDAARNVDRQINVETTETEVARVDFGVVPVGQFGKSG